MGVPRRSSKPPRRKLGFHNIAPRLASDGFWRWRPYLRTGGKQMWGRMCDTQEDAFAAYKRMAEVRQQGPRYVTYILAQAFEDTVQAMLDKGGSEHTAAGYRQKFKRWSTIFNPQVPVAQVTQTDVRVFMRERRQRHGVKANGMGDDLRLLKRVFNVAGRKGDLNPVTGIETPKGSTPQRPFFTMAEVVAIEGRILESDHPEARRDADLLLLLATTGVRRYELGRLRGMDITYHDKGGGFLSVRGKGGRVRLVGFHEELEPLVRRLVGNAEDEPFVSHETVASALKRWRKRLKEPRLNARALRRTWATSAAQHSPIHLVSQLMGHSQIKTTQLYLGIRQEELQAAAARTARSLRDARRKPSRRPRKPKTHARRTGKRGRPPR